MNTINVNAIRCYSLMLCLLNNMTCFLCLFFHLLLQENRWFLKALGGV